MNRGQGPVGSDGDGDKRAAHVVCSVGRDELYSRGNEVGEERVGVRAVDGRYGCEGEGGGHARAEAYIGQ